MSTVMLAHVYAIQDNMTHRLGRGIDGSPNVCGMDLYGLVCIFCPILNNDNFSKSGKMRICEVSAMGLR